MQQYKHVTIIGTSHIAKQSIKDITRSFTEINPSIVCVELDWKRLHALKTNQKPNYSLSGIKQYGLQGYLFAVVGGLIQRKLGNTVGIKPGADMLAAVKIAELNRKKLELIDQDIEITLKRLSKSFSFKEKMRLVADVVKAPFSKEKIQINLSEVPAQQMIEKLLYQLKDRYPNLYRVLIHERNVVMAKNIYRISQKNPSDNILVVIGAGHEDEIVSLLKKEEFKRDRIY